MLLSLFLSLLKSERKKQAFFAHLDVILSCFAACVVVSFLLLESFRVFPKRKVAVNLPKIESDTVDLVFVVVL